MHRKTIANGIACLVISLTGIGTAYADLTAVAGGPSTLGALPAIIAAPSDVLNGCVTGAGQLGFNEAQGVVTLAAFLADNGAVIPAGTLVDSHMILFNHAGSALESHTGVVWTFKRPIIAVMSEPGGIHEAASTFALGAPRTNYTVSPSPNIAGCTGAAPFAKRGLETTQSVAPFNHTLCPAGDDCYTVAGSTITVSMHVSEPGDWIRVVTTRDRELFLPVVLDNVAGLGGSHYTTELTLASKATTAIQVNLLYTASVGSGTGSASVTLAPGETRIIPNTIAFLRLQGLSIPTSGSVIGTLLATFDNSSSDPFIGARTFTTGGGGTFGLFYPGLTLGESATSVAYINGLQQSAAQRSNVAVVNRGDASDAITLNVSYFDGTGSALGTPTPVTLSPGQWTQFNQPLQALGATWGYAKIEKTSGNSTFVAYGVLNDAITSDGSYIPMSF